jgi:predicted AlkP superfamily pyrophosphatase or phosphodiesterase
MFLEIIIAYSCIAFQSVTAQPFNLASSSAEHQSNLKLSEHPVVIVISFDGVRYDYSTKGNTPNLDELSRNGVTVPYMKSQFMTKTFPNHQSIATGLYTEVHGISDNSFYDPESNKTLDGFAPEFWNYDANIVPVWVHTLDQISCKTAKCLKSIIL